MKDYIWNPIWIKGSNYEHFQDIVNGGLVVFIYLILLFSCFFIDTVRELLTHMPASVKSEQPTNPNYAITKDLAAESNLTALHLAAYSGSENVVRTLLNSSGVDVEGGCSPSVSDYDQ